MKLKSFRTELFLILVLIVQLVFMIYIKYNNQFVPLSQFNLFLTGNLITVLFYLILILGVLFLFKKNKIRNSKAILLIFLSYLFLFLAFYSNRIHLPFNRYYFFGQYGNKLFIGLAFTLYFATIVYFAFYIFYSGTKQKFFSAKAFFSTLIFMILFLAFSSVFILFNESKVNRANISDKDKNILVVLGAAVWSDNKPSPILASRVIKAAEVTKTGLIQKVYFTGGSAPGEMSEAEVAYKYFKELNPTFDKVEIETSTTSTNEQIQFIKNVILPKYPEYEIIVISDSFHLVRIREISNFHQIKIKTIASDFSMNFTSNLYNRLRESLALTVFWFFSI